jgi:hypothetical protein
VANQSYRAGNEWQTRGWGRNKKQETRNKKQRPRNKKSQTSKEYYQYFNTPTPDASLCSSMTNYESGAFPYKIMLKQQITTPVPEEEKGSGRARNGFRVTENKRLHETYTLEYNC